SRAATRVKTKCTGRSGNSTTSPTPTSHRWTNCSSIRKPNCLKSEVPADIPEESAEPEKPKRRTGRNLPAAFIVGAGLGGLAILAVSGVGALFRVFGAGGGGVALWELARAVAARELGLPAPPVAAGGALALALAYWKGERPLLACFAITVIVIVAWRLHGGADGYLRDVTAGVFALSYLALPACFVALMPAAPDGPRRPPVLL